MRPGRLAAQPLRVIPRGDQQQGSGVRADALQAQQARGAPGDQRDDEFVEVPDLGIQEPGAAAQLPQRDPGGIAGYVTRSRPQGRQLT